MKLLCVRTVLLCVGIVCIASGVVPVMLVGGFFVGAYVGLSEYALRAITSKEADNGE